MDAGAPAPVSVGSQTPLLPPDHHARQAFDANPIAKPDVRPNLHENGKLAVPCALPAQGIVAANTGIARAAIEMIADTASLIRRILRVRFPVQS